MNLLPVEKTVGARDESEESLLLCSLWAPTIEASDEFRKGENKKWSCFERRKERGREKSTETETEGKKRRAWLSPSNRLHACRPSDCPSSLFILAAFYPAGMINGFTEASLSSTPLAPGRTSNTAHAAFLLFFAPDYRPLSLPNAIHCPWLLLPLTPPHSIPSARNATSTGPIERLCCFDYLRARVSSWRTWNRFFVSSLALGYCLLPLEV